MTTHVVSQRFTAVEALSFYNEHFSGLPDDLLAHPLTLCMGFEPLRDPEVYWSRLSPQDLLRWQSFRVPPNSWDERLLRWILRSTLAWKLVAPIRRMLNI